MPDYAPRVFLSYSHDSKEHRDCVLALAERLRSDGIEAYLDQYEPKPAQGWSRWMQDQIEDADFVLVVATETYERRFRGHEEADRGLGVQWEAARLTQELYEAGAKTTTFVPVVFSRQDATCIPVVLRPFTWYDVSTEEGYEKLYRHLTDQPEVEPPPVGERRVLPPRRLLSAATVPVAGLRGGPAIFRVPYERNPYFTGRQDVLDALHEALTRDGSAALGQAEPSAALPQGTRTAISGLGGIGKTQTAVEYAYRHAGDYRAVFLVRAETAGELLGGFAEIGRVLGLPEAVAGDQEVTAAGVRRWLEAEDGWLLIFDNADRPELVKSFLPLQHRGHVLVTSRAQVFDVLGLAEPLRMATLSPAEALELLLKRGGRRSTSAEERGAAAELAEELGYLPLALEQAGAYLLQKNVRFGDYLDAYRQLGLGTLERQAPVVGNHPESVARTWTLNFQQVEDASPAAADVLRASSFFAPDDIPEELLTQGGAELGPAVSDALAGGDVLAGAELLEPLTRYSLIQRDVEARTWSVHRLVQEVVKASLRDDARRLWTERVVGALNSAFPDPEFSNWGLCGRLIPHTQTAVRWIEDHRLESETVARLLNEAAIYLWNSGRYAEAEPLCKRSLGIRKKALGEEHPAVADSHQCLGLLRHGQGRYTEAEQLYELSLGSYEKALGAEHPRIGIALSNLALLYCDLGRHAEAEPLFKRSLKIREKALGGEHPDVAIALNNLALPYCDQGRYAEAEPLFKRSLEIREKALGDEHPDVAISLNNLANLFRAQARNAEAEPLFKRSLEIFEKALGDEHPHVATSLYNLALLCHDQGRLADAEQLYERALKISEKALDAEHPDMATVVEDYAVLLRDTGRTSEAEAMEARARTIRERHASRERESPKALPLL